ncbi:MAG TPA: hypothetical protein VMM80_02345 [Bacteroidota bacterium]|nr:hypothetical protein [Bacteroidota bacterium]
MKHLRVHLPNATPVIVTLTALLAAVAPAFAQFEARWMAVGSLHHWFASTGHEIEEGRVAEQQDGLQWPAYFKYQDMDAASGLWVGVTNWTDATGTHFPVKVVHVGPRDAGTGEFFPVLFHTTSRFTPPVVIVDGAPSTDKPLTNDDVDPALKCDRMIINTCNTAIGVTMTRRILAWGQAYNDNYFIYEYTFTNTGQTTGTTAAPLASQTLSGFTVFFQSRYSVCFDTRYEFGNPTGWGINTINDARGDGVKIDPPGQQFRCRFAWHGRYPGFAAYDDIGGPMFTPALPASDVSDTVGRLGNAQFVGTVTLHADHSAIDTTDDPSQPSTTLYVGSDDPLNSQNDQFNIAKMQQEYALMTSGHMSPRHADRVVPDGNFDQQTNDPSVGSDGRSSSGGQSNADGYGPYTLAPGQSIHIVMAEGAAGLSRERCIAIGRQFKAGTITAKAKNDSVLTGRDSLFQTFARAMANYNSGYNVPQPPLPPRDLTVTSSGDKVQLDWGVYDPSDPNLRGFKVYRSVGRWDALYTLVDSVGPTTRSFADANVARGPANYYYVVSVGVPNAVSNGTTPLGAVLSSNRIFAQSYDPAYLKRQAGHSMDSIRIVPNPYSIASDVSRLRFSQNEADKIAFFNIPGYCKIRIYTEVGELIKEIDHNDGSGDAYWYSNTSSGQVIVSGVYIVVFEDSRTGQRVMRKLAVIR